MTNLEAFVVRMYRACHNHVSQIDWTHCTHLSERIMTTNFNRLEGARQSAGCSQELLQYLYFLRYYCLKLCKFLFPTTIHNVESSDVSIFFLSTVTVLCFHKICSEIVHA